MSGLFSRGALRDVLESHLRETRDRILNSDFKAFSGSGGGTLEAHFLQDFALVPPVLLTDKASKGEPVETTIIQRGYGRETRLPAMSLTVTIPTEGTSELLKFMPSKFTTVIPKGELVGNQVRITFEWQQDSQFDIKSAYSERLTELKEYVSWVAEEVNSYVPRIEDTIKKSVAQKNEMAKRAKNVADDLDLPLK